VDSAAVEIDINARRHAEIAFHGLTGVDDVYTFYYDETNNPRRLHVTPDGFNVTAPQCFVLGGVAHRGPPRPLDVEGLKQAVRLQASAKELKLAHLGKGDIFRLLASPKVEAFVDWLAAEDLLVHYFALDPLYWSTVDIIDSVISHGSVAHMQAFHLPLKDDLFAVLAADADDIADLFHRFSYPNVDRANRRAFLRELLRRLETREAVLDEFGYYMLKGVLQAGVHVESLTYLEGETPNTLIDSFAEFFVGRICLFKNARHLLDVEEVVQARLSTYRFRDGDRDADNFAFVDSQAEVGVQVSDALVGLLGKLFSYVTRVDAEQLLADRRALTAVQARTLGKLNGLLDRSQSQTPALFQQIVSLRSMCAGQFFLEGR